MDGQEGLLQETDAFPLLLLRLLKNDLHLLHVARRVAADVLQELLVALPSLRRLRFCSDSLEMRITKCAIFLKG